MYVKYSVGDGPELPIIFQRDSDPGKYRISLLRTKWGVHVLKSRQNTSLRGGIQAWKTLRASVCVPQLPCILCAVMELPKKV